METIWGKYGHSDAGTHSAFVPKAVAAQYTTEQPNPTWVNNKCIAALPEVLSVDRVAEYLTDVPPFDVSERALPDEMRFARIMQLHRCLFPFPRHLRLATNIDMMLRESLVGRDAGTVEHVALLQEFYEKRKCGELARPPVPFNPGLTASLIGVPGTGKTTVVKRTLALFPQAIRHEFGFIQLVYVFLQCPSNGASIFALAIDFFQQIDDLLGTRYVEEYTKHGMTIDKITTKMASVAHRHCLAMLVVDDIQKLQNAYKGKEGVLSGFLHQLVEKLRCGLLLIGTNAAEHLLQRDFSEARRAAGIDIGYVDRCVPVWALNELRQKDGLPPLSGDELPDFDEWRYMVHGSWHFCWLRKPVPLSFELERTLLDLTQGVPDIYFKLLITAQRRAILDGSETYSVQLFQRTFRECFSILEPMMQALRTGNATLLRQYADLTPLKFDAIAATQDAQLRLASHVNRKRSTEEARAAVAAIVGAFGIPGDVARSLADRATEHETDIATATKQVLADIRPPRRRKPISSRADEEFGENDLRGIWLNARKTGTSIVNLIADKQEATFKNLFGE